MNPMRETLYDNTWFGHAWKTMNKNIEEKIVNYSHNEIRTDVMNHAISRIRSYVGEKL